MMPVISVCSTSLQVPEEQSSALAYPSGLASGSCRWGLVSGELTKVSSRGVVLSCTSAKLMTSRTISCMTHTYISACQPLLSLLLILLRTADFAFNSSIAPSTSCVCWDGMCSLPLSHDETLHELTPHKCAQTYLKPAWVPKLPLHCNSM